MLTMEKSAANLPGNTALWGDIILAEACQRCPDLDGRISGFQLVHTTDKGDGTCLILLEGQKAFIPAIVKEFVLQPLDVIIYKEGKETKQCYISKRNILKLTVSASLGKPVGRVPGKRISDVGVNFFSPSGGSMMSSNPFFSGSGGAMMQSKSASAEDRFNYASEVLDAYNYWKESNDIRRVLNKTANTELPESISSFVTLSKTASGKNIVYAKEFPEGKVVTNDEVTNLFRTVGDYSQRMEKFANFTNNNHVLFGDVISTQGNVFTSERSKYTHAISHHQNMPIPKVADIYMYNGIPTYFNPNVKKVDGTSAGNYCLAARLGDFTVGKDFNGFRYRNESSSVAVDLNQILPVIKDKAIDKNDLIVLLEKHDRNITVPLRVIFVEYGLQGEVTLKVRPEIGTDAVYTIKFFNGTKILQANDNTFLYPILDHQIRHLPERFVKEYEFKRSSEQHFKHHTVKILKGSHLNYCIKEDNNSSFTIPEEKAFFMLINKYGLDDKQAIATLKKVFTAGETILLVKRYSDEVNIDELNSKKGYDSMSISPMEKEAINSTIKLASTLSDGAGKITEFLNSNADKLQFHDGVVESWLSKTAGYNPNSSSGGEPGQQRSQDNATRSGMAGTTSGLDNGGGGLLQSLIRIPQTEKNTREIIDLLTYYALGKIRPEEKTNIIKQLTTELESSENLICKLMLFNQLDQIPGQDYTDLKILVSDIDSYLTALSSTMLLI
jgi:hypothetical protein